MFRNEQAAAEEEEEVSEGESVEEGGPGNMATKKEVEVEVHWTIESPDH